MYTEKNNSSPGACRQGQGNLPGSCGALAFPFVAMQQQDPPRYDQREALQQGTLFPGLDLPFHKELRSRFPAANSALSELMALDFAIDELGLYLVTHADDKEVLDLYWKYIGPGQRGPGPVSGAVRSPDPDRRHGGRLQVAQRPVALG